jgi:hypothetical protein
MDDLAIGQLDLKLFGALFDLSHDGLLRLRNLFDDQIELLAELFRDAAL